MMAGELLVYDDDIGPDPIYKFTFDTTGLESDMMNTMHLEATHAITGQPKIIDFVYLDEYDFTTGKTQLELREEAKAMTAMTDEQEELAEQFNITPTLKLFADEACTDQTDSPSTKRVYLLLSDDGNFYIVFNGKGDFAGYTTDEVFKALMKERGW